MKKQLFTLILALSALTALCQNKDFQKKQLLINKVVSESSTTRFSFVKIDGLDIFYREAGSKDKPTILLLHGFPSSSHMYRDIITDLSSRYHVIAPDYPGFGQSSAPGVNEYTYTFDNLSHTMDQFIDALNLTKISLYMQDYGGPVGFRIAARRPSLIQSLIIQNANAYNEGIGDAAMPLVAYFKNPNEQTEKDAKGILNTTKWQYTDGAEDISKVSPDSYLVDQFYLDRPGNDEIQLSLFRNYGSNLALYDSWHEYFKKKQPATLVVWGRNDQIFIAPGAKAFKKDLENVEIHMINGGHFILEEHHSKVAGLIDNFLSRLK